ncbi:inositol monophosphatase [Nitratireductor sp. XY-223]|uniref:inositol monophosphatase family protein n=1 Tax=Nitratireductor sp. XY-223 TaxID=2561926 RepID=UPI0010A9F550|nr:inositol monophosphatase [Nitratireductor sp. XY-223]
MTLSDSEISALVSLLKETGETEIMPRFSGVNDAEIKQKQASWDVVTEADTAAEKCIANVLSARYPRALIVGEEAVAGEPAIMNGLAEADLAFVIDPVDGTYNFASGMPTFGTILAVVAGGECVAGMIHYPAGGETLMGVSGAGSRLVEADGTERPVRVSEPVALDQMVGTVSWGFMEEPLRSRVAGGLSKIGMSFGFRCSAWEYRLAATGRAHFVGAQNLMPWDHLAGVLIHSEAGGYTACLDGSPYRPGIVDGGLITATDPESWALIRREIFGL